MNISTFSVLTTALLLSTSSFASTFDATAVQSVLNDITVSTPTCAAAPCDSSIDAAIDFEQFDQYWSVTGSGGSVATMIVELAGSASNSKLGVYDRFDATRRAILFDSANDAGDQVTLRILSDGRVIASVFDPDTYSVSGGYTGVDFSSNSFGYFLETEAGDIYYSDEALNSDDADHMKTYQGNDADMIEVPGYARGEFTDNEFVLAWEGGRVDAASEYIDLVVIVESVKPISEPLGVGLVGLGLLALGVGMRSRK